MNCCETLMNDRVLKLEITVLKFYPTINDIGFHIVLINLS